MKLLDTVSNRELNIAATLLIDVVVTAYYFTSLFSLPGGVDFTSPAMAAIVGKIIVISIVLSIIIFAIINRSRGEEARDERDYRFESTANRYAYVVLVVCICAIMGHLAINEWLAAYAAVPDTYTVATSPMVVVHSLLLSLLLASATKAITQLVLYRLNAGY